MIRNINLEILRNMKNRLAIFVTHLHINTDFNGILLLVISVVYVKPGSKIQEVIIPTPPHKLIPVKLLKILVILTQSLH